MPAPDATAATWIRETVWPPHWVRNYDHIPGTFTDCACQRPPSVECQRGAHGQCRHDGRPVNETVIQTSSHRPATFRDPYTHSSPVRSGRNVLAWVWPAGPSCRQICTCACHSAPRSEATMPDDTPTQHPAATPATARRPLAPLGSPAAWQTVMKAAGYQCQCADGLCGSRHAVSGLRCDMTPDRTRLLAAPLDLTLTPAATAAVPVAELRAWCAACHSKATARQRAAERELRRQTDDEPLSLF